MSSKLMMQELFSRRALDTTGQIALKHILFATDFSPAADKAFPYALEIAQRYSATLFAVHISSAPIHPYAPPADWPRLSGDEEIFYRQAAHHLETRMHSVSHELIFRKGNVWETISGILAEKHIDMLVLGTRGRTGLEKVLMGSVAEDIFRQSTCPVLTVGPHVTASSRSTAQLSRILYATDFSPESLTAAPYAISLAREHRAQLLLLNCADEPGEAHGMLHTLRELMPFGTDLRCEPACIAAHGPHGEKIIEVAESHGADVIVLGVSSGDRKVNKKPSFHSSALYKIVTRATCPVLTVRA